MLREMLKNSGIKSQAKYVEVGYGQVEPNHLSAQRNAQIYAQLPADAKIEVLEQGQFVKYDYANGVVNFEGPGEWMMVYNETKLYRDEQLDCEFAMVKGNYQARVYSPLDGEHAAEEMYGPTRFLQGKREKYNNESGEFEPLENITAGKFGGDADYSVASQVHDYREMNDINDPAIDNEARKRLFMKLRELDNCEKMMPAGTTMVPRVFKTMPGDIYTTNFVNETELVLGEKLCVGADGMLVKEASANEAPVEVGAANGNKYKTAASGDMRWQVVKLYTMPDFQKGVKLMRIV